MTEGEAVPKDAKPAQPSGSRRWEAVALGLLVGLAGALRFYHLGRSSMWIDEGASVTMARLPWRELVRTLWQYEANMTTYYLLLRGWIYFGDSEAVLRSLSALCGVATVVAIFVLGRRLFSARVGFLAGGLLSVNLFHLWFSQEARSYALVILLATLSLYLFARASEEPRRRWHWAGYVIVTVLGAYGHVFMTLLIPAQWIALGPRRLRDLGVRRATPVLAGLAVLLTPLAAFVLGHDRGQLSWIPPLDLPNVLLTFFGIAGFNPLLLLLVLSGLYLALRRGMRDAEDAFGLRLVAYSFIVPIVIAALVSLWKPIFFFRYFAVCVPSAMVLGARALSPARPLKRARRVAVAAGATLTLLVSSLLLPTYYDQFLNWAGDWRSATDYLLAHRQADDAVVFYASAGFDSYRYYRDRVPGRAGAAPLPQVVFPPEGVIASEHLEPTPATFEEAARHHRRLWVVLHLKEPSDLPQPFLRPFHRVSQRAFAGKTPGMPFTITLYERD